MMPRKFLIIGCLVFTFLLFSNLATSQQAKIFLLDIDLHRDDSVFLRQFSLENGTPTDFPLIFEEYLLEIRNQDGAILFKTPFRADFHAYPFAQPAIDIEELNFVWRLPFSLEAETINIYRGNENIFKLEIPEYLCVSDDNVCYEYCRERGIDADCVSAADNYLPLLLILGIFIILIIIFYFYKKSK